MIVAVKGKRVGGLTATDLEIELEAGGAELILLISRHKNSDNDARRAHLTEQRYLSALDRDVNNDRLLQWIDIGASSPPRKERRDSPNRRGQRNTLHSKSSDLWNEQGSAYELGSKGVDRDELKLKSKKRIPDSIGDSEDDSSLDRILKPRRATQSDDYPVQHASAPRRYTPTNSSGQPLIRNMDLLGSHNINNCCADSADHAGSDEGLSLRSERQTGSNKATSSTETTIHKVATARFDQSTRDEESILNSVPTSQAEKELQEAALSDAGSDTETLEPEWEDDGNAWCGCVCGETHTQETNVFWIQCDGCGSWYNVHSVCVGFDKTKAINMERWICWGCEEADSSSAKDLEASIDETKHVKDPRTDKKKRVSASLGNSDKGNVEKARTTSEQSVITAYKERADGSFPPKNKPKRKKDGTHQKPGGSIPRGYAWNDQKGFWSPSGGATKEEADDPPNTSSKQDMKRKIVPRTTPKVRRNRPRHPEDADTSVPLSSNKDSSCDSAHSTDSNSDDGYGVDTVHKVGSIVFIREHAWPSVNNTEGIAKVTKSYEDEDGDQLYDIKYIVGGVAKGVFAKYVRAYTFY
jgi:hypothetical protein